MINERQMEQLPEIFVERYQAVYDKYLKIVGEHIKEIGTLSPTDIHRLEQFAKMNKNLDEIKRDLEDAAQISTEELNRVFAKVSTEQYEGFANSYLAKGLVQTEILKQTVLKRQINAIGKITENTFFNLSNTTAMSDLYKECLDTGILAVQQGLTDYKSAVREVIQKTAVEGNKVIIRSNETGEIKKVKDQVTYESGYKRRRDTAVRMNVLDGVRDINQAVALHVGEEFGADGVEISVHGNCAEDHLYIQGKQYSLKAYEKLQESLRRRIGVWNCHHFAMPIILGVSKPLYSQEELDEINRKSTEEITINGTTKTRYEWTQVQRRIETKVREQKDIANVAKASGDDTLRRVAQAKINKYTDTYEYISQKAGIPTKKERMSVSGFRAVKANKTLTNSGKHGIITSQVEKIMNINNIDSPIEQRNTAKGNPNAILMFDRPLNNRQQKLLESLNGYDTRTIVPKKSVNMKDLSALTAVTGDEFALFTKGNERLVIRGNNNSVNIDKEQALELNKLGYKWSGHTHPGMGKNCLQASPGDVEILKCFNQKVAYIYNSQGIYLGFERK